MKQDQKTKSSSNTNALERSVAIVLSGCGSNEGTEVTEAVSTMIALTEAHVSYQCYAPNIGSVIAEAKKIARGNVRPLSDLKSKHHDALVLPGGAGAAKVLSTFSEHGAKGKVLPELETVIRDFHSDSKPIGAICIAPTLLALTLGKLGIEVTVGDDAEVIAEILKTGSLHTVCKVEDYVSDRDNKVLTTPAYMYEATAHQVFTGIRKMIRELAEMA